MGERYGEYMWLVALYLRLVFLCGLNASKIVPCTKCDECALMKFSPYSHSMWLAVWQCFQQESILYKFTHTSGQTLCEYYIFL